MSMNGMERETMAKQVENKGRDFFYHGEVRDSWGGGGQMGWGGVGIKIVVTG